MDAKIVRIIGKIFHGRMTVVIEYSDGKIAKASGVARHRR